MNILAALLCGFIQKFHHINPNFSTFLYLHCSGGFSNMECVYTQELLTFFPNVLSICCWHLFSVHKMKHCCIFLFLFCSLDTSTVSCWNLWCISVCCCFQGYSNTLLLYINAGFPFIFLLNWLCSLPLTVPDDSTECYQSSKTTTVDADLWSREKKADESLEMSHQTIESFLLGVGSQLENEDYLMGISCRLQTALEKMLMVITDTTNQVQSSPTHETHLLYFGHTFHTPTF